MPSNRRDSSFHYLLVARLVVAGAALFAILSFGFTDMLTVLVVLAFILIVSEGFYRLVVRIQRARKERETKRDKEERIRIAQRESSSKYFELSSFRDAAKDRKPK